MGEEDDPYESVAKGKLKLKSDTSIKKKKKKNKKLLEQVAKTIESTSSQEDKPKLTKTKAELAFKQQQEKMVNLFTTSTHLNITVKFRLQQTKRILEKATMTHKERVEKFNQHLDGLTEHFDIPKVSWTK